MLRRPPTRIELKPEDKQEVRRVVVAVGRGTLPPSAASSRPRDDRSFVRSFVRSIVGSRPSANPDPPSPPLSLPLARSLSQYEEARKAHIRKLQADLARGTTETLVANSFQFNPDGATKEERLGIDPQPQKPAPNASDDAA